MEISVSISCVEAIMFAASSPAQQISHLLVLRFPGEVMQRRDALMYHICLGFVIDDHDRVAITSSIFVLYIYVLVLNAFVSD